MEQKIIEVSSSRRRKNQQLQQPPQVPVVQRPNISGKPRHLMYYRLNTPLRPNPIQRIFETVSPVIQFEHLPFFKILETLSNSIHFKSDFANFFGVYNPSSDFRRSVLKSWNIKRQEYKIQIILIFQQVGLDENVKKRLPNNIKVSINGHKCKLPEINQMDPGITPWRKNVPIDITQQTHLRSDSRNILKITWSAEPHEYKACVYVAEKLTCNDLLKELEKKPKRTSDKTKELIKECMKNDDDVIVDFLFASVKDPLSKLRMKYPARGVDCEHLQCFDALQFLQLNEQKETWKCPICKKEMIFKNIEIDEYFLNMLQSEYLSEECENVVLFKNGTWSERKSREFSKNSRTNAYQSTNKIEVFQLTDSDDTDNSNINLDNIDNDESIPKSKLFKYNPLE